MYRKIIKAVSVILSVTMLMGITVFADTITDLQNQKNQKEKESLKTNYDRLQTIIDDLDKKLNELDILPDKKVYINVLKNK